MKTGTSLLSSRITFTIAANSSLWNQDTVITVTAGGRMIGDYNGKFPPSGGLTVAFSYKWSLVETVVVDTLINGAPIAAARDGTLSIVAL
jgi:hypothetical protein